MKFTETQLEAAIIELLGEQGIPHLIGEQLETLPASDLYKGIKTFCKWLNGGAYMSLGTVC